MKNILISAECVGDLPTSLLQKNDIVVIYYDIRTESGVFRDTDEIDSQNVMEYMVGGKKMAHSVVPTANDYKDYFNKNLREYDEIVHICISSGVSEAYQNAMLGRAKMGLDGNKVYIVDSKHLSSGLGMVTLEAVRCRNEGMSSKNIVKHMEEFIPKVSTSFLTNNADYLYYNRKVKKIVMEVCQKLRLHPVLGMVDGKLTVRKVYIGSYNKAAKKYIKEAVKNAKDIMTEYAFVTYAGCDVELLDMVKSTVESFIQFDTLYLQQASATVSCNCGPKTFGVLYVQK